MTWNENITHWIWFWVANPTQNYANSDEVLLDDRNRPRDEYGFRLQPWRQMDKFNFRDSNKDVLEYLYMPWGKEITWTTAANMSSYTAVNIPLYMDNTRRFKADNWSVYYYTEEDLEDIYKWEKFWKVFWDADNWYVVVPQTWIYMIQYFVQFNWQQWTSTSYNNAPKLFAQLTYTSPKWEKKYLEYIYWWWVVNPDFLSGINVNMLDKWYKIWLDALHSRNNTKAFCAWWIKILKLS